MKKTPKEPKGTGFMAPSIGQPIPKEAKLVRMKNGRIKWVLPNKKKGAKQS